MKRIFIGISILFILIYLPFLDKIPLIAMDEPAYAQTAYMFAQGKGMINTIWVGSGQEFFLYPLLLSGFYTLFGCSLWTIRFLSLVCGLLALGGFLTLCRQFKLSSFYQIFASVFFISCNVHFIIFRSGRPESLVLALTLWSMVALMVFLDTKKQWPGFVSGCLSGLAVLAHPIGIFWLFFSGVWMLSNRLKMSLKSGITTTALLCGAGLLTVMLWSVIYLQSHTVSHLINVVLHRSSTESLMINTFLANINRLYLGYSLGLKRLPLVIFELFFLGTGALFLKGKSRYLALFGLFYLGLGCLVLAPFLIRYMALIPFISILSALIISEQTSSSLKKYAIYAAVFGYIGYSIAGQAVVTLKQKNNPDYSFVETFVSASLPKDARVLVPIQLWFAVKDRTMYCDTQDGMNLRDKKDLLAFLNSGNVDSLVIWEALLLKTSPTSGLKQTLYNSDPSQQFFTTCYEYATEHHWNVSHLKTPKGTLYCFSAVKP